MVKTASLNNRLKVSKKKIKDKLQYLLALNSKTSAKEVYKVVLIPTLKNPKK